MRHYVPKAPFNAVDRSANLAHVLICFSHLRWNFVHQRPQHLLTRAATRYTVLFFEEPIFGRNVVPHLQSSKQPSGVTVYVPHLPEGLGEDELAALQRELFDDLIADHAGQSLTFWYYTPMALTFSRHVTPDLCIYDCMDELSAFRGASPRLRALERILFSRADLVFTGGMSLYEAKRRQHRNVHGFPSSIDAHHFGKARRSAADEPADQATIPHPRIGFFGVIDERMDLDLVARLAELRPDWHLVMIGPVVKIDPATLPRPANVHWLGHKSYDALPAYLSGWDAGFMPFALNEATEFISPTKTPEFLAAGVPVASTAIADVVSPYGESGLVEIGRDAEDMARRIGKLLAMDRSTWLPQVDRYLATISWDRTWAQMLTLMREAERTGAGRLQDSVKSRPAVASDSLLPRLRVALPAA